MILGINIDHIATLRQARLATEPDPVMAATLAILGGADGITLHLREDRRHVNDRDLDMLRGFVTVELNLEMACNDEMIRIAMKNVPDLVTIVPEKRQELTTEGGLNMKTARSALKHGIRRLKDKGISTSLFINPVREDVDLSNDVGADMVEIHTGRYANVRGKDQELEREKVAGAIMHAQEIGLRVNAGHGLNYHNVTGIAEIEGIRGLYIGHSIISRAVLVGMEKAVRDMKELVMMACPVQ